MSRLTPEQLREKLFKVATRPRDYLQHEWIVLPEALQPIPASQLFSSDSDRRRILELGSGWGEFAARFLEQHPDLDYIAFEIKAERIRQLIDYVQKLDQAGQAGRTYMRIVPVNFNWFLDEILPAYSFDTIVINFPDPWPKRRHWKHRLIQPGMAERLAGLLRPGGWLHLATDYAPYARRMLRILRDCPQLHSCFENPDYRRERPDDFPGTYFELRSIREGTRPFYFRFGLRD